MLLGETRIDIHKQLVKEQGKFDKTNLALDVKVGKQNFLSKMTQSEVYCLYFLQGEVKASQSAAAASASNGRSSRVKVGEIFAMLDGMRIDTKLLLTNSNRNVARFVSNTNIARFLFIQHGIYCFRANGEAAAAAAAAGESSSADPESRVVNGTAASNNNPAGSGGDGAGGARPRTRSNDVEAVIPAASRTPNGTPQSSSRTPNGTPATGAAVAAAAAPLPVPAGDPAAAAQVPLPEEPLPPG